MRVLKSDVLGYVASLSCLIHCFLVPLIVPLVSFFGISVFADSKVELFVASMSFVVLFCVLFLGFYRYHRRWLPFIYFLLGVTIFFVRSFFSFFHEIWFDLLGGLILFLGVLLNSRLCSSCISCTENIDNVSDGECCE